MKWAKKLLHTIIYTMSAVIVARCTIYCVMRFNEIILNIYSVYVVLAIIYFFILCSWCVCLLIGQYAINKISSIFLVLGLSLLSFSLVYMSLFQFSFLPRFEPLELVFFVYDTSLLGAIVSLLSLVVGRKNIKGIRN
jgi:hypothetical protein